MDGGGADAKLSAGADGNEGGAYAKVSATGAANGCLVADAKWSAGACGKLGSGTEAELSGEGRNGGGCAGKADDRTAEEQSMFSVATPKYGDALAAAPPKSDETSPAGEAAGAETASGCEAQLNKFVAPPSLGVPLKSPSVARVVDASAVEVLSCGGTLPAPSWRPTHSPAALLPHATSVR